LLSIHAIFYRLSVSQEELAALRNKLLVRLIHLRVF
jgi:hypothetical protein